MIAYKFANVESECEALSSLMSNGGSSVFEDCHLMSQEQLTGMFFHQANVSQTPIDLLVLLGRGGAFIFFNEVSVEFGRYSDNPAMKALADQVFGKK